MNRLILRFLRDNSAATSIEYAILASGIAVIIVASVNSLGSKVNGNYLSVSAALK
jgi:pilus assembly protein Flp/PilA